MILAPATKLNRKSRCAKLIPLESRYRQVLSHVFSINSSIYIVIYNCLYSCLYNESNCTCWYIESYIHMSINEPTRTQKTPFAGCCRKSLAWRKERPSRRPRRQRRTKVHLGQRHPRAKRSPSPVRATVPKVHVPRSRKEPDAKRGTVPALLSPLKLNPISKWRLCEHVVAILLVEPTCSNACYVLGFLTMWWTHGRVMSNSMHLWIYVGETGYVACGLPQHMPGGPSATSVDQQLVK